jgi:heme exporter protein A
VTLDTVDNSSSAPTLTAAHLGAQRGDRPLFKALELSLLPGQVVWLRGRNGRGKTSLLRLLAGLSTPARGAVLCNGVPLAQCPPEWRRKLLYVAHANALKDDLTVHEALRFLGALHGRTPSSNEIRAALGTLGVGHLHAAAVRTLSQGQRRRCALSRLALPDGADGAAIWLLDEPYDALDHEGVQALHGLLSGHARQGGSTLLTSHQDVTLRDPLPMVLDLDAVAVSP